jgi:hypothetical protein
VLDCVKKVKDYFWKYGVPIYSAERLHKKAKEIESEFPELDDIFILTIHIDGKRLAKEMYGIDECKNFSYKGFLNYVLEKKRKALNKASIYGTEFWKNAMFLCCAYNLLLHDYFFSTITLCGYLFSMKGLQLTEKSQEEIKKLAKYAKAILEEYEKKEK